MLWPGVIEDVVVLVVNKACTLFKSCYTVCIYILLVFCSDGLIITYTTRMYIIYQPVTSRYIVEAKLEVYMDSNKRNMQLNNDMNIVL